jgi:hypothetical protein
MDHQNRNLFLTSQTEICSRHNKYVQLPDNSGCQTGNVHQFDWRRQSGETKHLGTIEAKSRENFRWEDFGYVITVPVISALSKINFERNTNCLAPDS